MRPLRYSINVTLDGCCHHEAGLPPDEESMRYWTASMERADALLFGRVTYEMMESAWRQPATGTWPDWMGEWKIPFAETIDRAKKYVVSSTLNGVDWNAELVRGDLEAGGPAAQAGARRGPVRGWRDAPPGVGRSGTDRRVRVPCAAGPCRTRADVARRSARAHPARARGSPEFRPGQGAALGHAATQSPVERGERCALGRTRTCAHGSGGHWRRQAPISTARGARRRRSRRRCGGAPSAGLEPAHTAPEADALSAELRGRGCAPSGRRSLGADRRQVQGATLAGRSWSTAPGPAAGRLPLTGARLGDLGPIGSSTPAGPSRGTPISARALTQSTKRA